MTIHFLFALKSGLIQLDPQIDALFNPYVFPKLKIKPNFLS